MYTHMERKPTSGANNGQVENIISKPRQRWESEEAFGPHREASPGEEYDPEDLTLIHKLIPTRKYGHSSSQNKSEPT